MTTSTRSVKITLRTSPSTAEDFRALPGRMSELLGFPVSLNGAFAAAVGALTDVYARPPRWPGQGGYGEGKVNLPPGPSNVGLSQESRRLLRRIQDELIRRNGMRVYASEVVQEALCRLAEQLGPWVRHGGPRRSVGVVEGPEAPEEVRGEASSESAEEVDGEVTG
jgi:hypothetical protein